MKKIFNFNLFFFFILFIGSPVLTSAEIFVHDGIALKGEEISIKAETKGRYFSKGGQMVNFFLGKKPIGNALSGGDGFAYKSFIPHTSGLNIIVAKYGKDSDRGIIMSLKKDSKIVFIDVEGSLLSSPFSKEPIERSRDIIKSIIKKYPVVYLHTGVIGIKSIREWLRKNRFPESVVLPWEMGSVFNDLNKKGIKIKAIIGSLPVIESAIDYKPVAFTFDESDYAEKVKDWKEIGKKLK